MCIYIFLFIRHPQIGSNPAAVIFGFCCSSLLHLVQEIRNASWIFVREWEKQRGTAGLKNPKQTTKPLNIIFKQIDL